MKVLTKLLIPTLFLPIMLQAQKQDSSHHTVNAKRLWVVSSISAAGYTGAIYGLSELWYKNTDQQSFKFFNDIPEWKQVDKLGHFYSSFYTSYASANILRWCDVEQKKSILIGSLTGFMVMAPIEVLDGFSDAYGASAGDLIANAAGASFFLAQSLKWGEVRIYPKFSFHETGYASQRPNVLGDNLTSKILKDYNGQTHWVSVDMDKFMRFPKWLNLAVGYGAEGMIYARDYQNVAANYHPYRQYYLSLDFDLTAIKTKSKTLKTLIFIANMIKLPAPSIEFSKKGVSWHSFYF